jgi:hypothetical protein
LNQQTVYGRKPFKQTILMSRAFGIFFGLLFLCSCATEPAVRTGLPADVTMNPEAGRGGWLIVLIRLEDGQELPFVVDTGSKDTIFDRSLASKLGARLDTVTVNNWDVTNKAGVYAAPRFYLKNVLLMTGAHVLAADLTTNTGGCLVKGILGMDVLEHYCIQLDFAARKMRFLDNRRANPQAWGKPFTLAAISASDPRPLVTENLVGAREPRSLIDVGCTGDGWLQPSFYQQWTNRQIEPKNGEPPDPDAWLSGDTYRGVYLIEENCDFSGIGLLFLSRHLVTFDFPNQTMYLKRTWNSYGPLMFGDMWGAFRFVKSLKEAGRLPGFSRTDEIITEGPITERPRYDVRYPNSITCILRKKGDPLFYQYTLVRTSIYAPWKLQKAWQTDQCKESWGLLQPGD